MMYINIQAQNTRLYPPANASLPYLLPKYLDSTDQHIADANIGASCVLFLLFSI